ncbi:hypothetical protein [Chondromyces crocatus]|nr:hypothetical protein [Chondromyces crocatus]
MPRPRGLLLTATLAAALLVPPTARAQEQPPVERTWYGWQNLIGLGAAYSLGALDLALDSRWAPLTIASIGTYALSSPIIHMVHGNRLEAGASFGLNLGVPFVTGLLGAFLYCSAVDCRYKATRDISTGAMIGGLAGMLTANVIDVAFLAVEKVESPTPSVANPFALEAARYRPLFQAGWQF